MSRACEGLGFKRWGVRLALGAVVGAALTMAVALWGTISHDPNKFGFRVAAGTGDSRHSTALRSSTWLLVGPGEARLAAMTPTQLHRHARGREYTWGVGRASYAEPPRPFAVWLFVESGWPAAAFWGWEREDVVDATPGPGRRVMTTRGGLMDLPLAMRVPPPGVLPFPMRPVWTGLAFNTLFYGGLAVLLWRAPRFVLRRAWKRRGCCTACGYDLKGSAGVCPECGCA